MAKTKSTGKTDKPALPAETPAAVALQLEYLEIKDVEDAKLRLMETLEGGGPVSIGIGRVSTVDTAGVQLLLAFNAEAVTRGVAVEFCGESLLLGNALALLGLKDSLPLVSRRD